MIWLLIDSFVIKTDSSKSSSLVLGELFDIGLKYMDCLRRSNHDMEIVTDLVRAIRVNREDDFTLEMRKGKDYVPYCVYLTPTAKETL